MEKQLQDSNLLPIFEIEVMDKRTNEKDYVLIDVFFRGNSLVGQRVGFTVKEERSKKIANTTILVDTDFDLDKNLQALYDAVISDIIDSEFFELI